MTRFRAERTNPLDADRYAAKKKATKKRDGLEEPAVRTRGNEKGA